MSQLMTVRYPNSVADYELSESTPQVGDVLKRNGDNWVVETVTQEQDGSATVTLRPGLKPVESPKST